MTRQRGFTLLEVMVAMAITALGLSATYYAVMQSIGAIDRLQEKTFAHWIALNRLTEMRLQQQVVETGENDGDLEYADQRWLWSSKVSETQVENLYRVDIAVSRLSATYYAVMQSIGAIDRLQEKTFAHWIALNRLTEMRLQQQVVETGENDGDLEYADQRWLWSSKVSETQVENLYRVDIAVSKENSPDDVVSDIVGFIGPPIVGNGSILPWSSEPAEDSG